MADETERNCRSCLFWSPNQDDWKEGETSICRNEKRGGESNGENTCEFQLSKEDTAANVPNHLNERAMFEPNPNAVDGPCEILIVSYWKDFPWLVYCLRSIQKFCTGFSGVTVAIPRSDRQRFESEVWSQIPGFDSSWIHVREFDEVPGKGMLHHMAVMASAHEYVPQGTKYVLLHDSDGIFTMPSRPEHFFADDLPYWLIRTWASLGVLDRRHPIAKVASDCAMWKGPTDAQLGWDTEYYTMCVNTQAMPIDFFPAYCEFLEDRHRQSFLQYFLSGQNQWPQDRMDFTAMGAWAMRFMPDKFRWFDVEDGTPFPGDRKKAYHSHSGLNDSIRAEIEGFLK